MKRIFVMAIALVSMAFASLAQDSATKLNVYFDYFGRPNSIPFIWAEALRNNVMEGIQKTNRVNLIDVDSRSSLSIEKERRDQDNVSAGEDMERLAVMKEEGANLLINGTISDISVRELTDSKGAVTGYESSITFSIKVIDPTNGTTVLTKNYTLPKNSLLDVVNLNTTGNTKDEAVNNRAKTIVKEMKKFVEEAFPAEGQILELDECKGDEAKTAYINLGADNGMANGAKFEVRVKRLIGGKTSYKMLGEAEVCDVESDDLSKIKIKKGGKLIYEAVKAGQDVVVRSKQ